MRPCRYGRPHPICQHLYVTRMRVQSPKVTFFPSRREHRVCRCLGSEGVERVDEEVLRRHTGADSKVPDAVEIAVRQKFRAVAAEEGTVLEVLVVGTACRRWHSGNSAPWRRNAVQDAKKEPDGLFRLFLKPQDFRNLWGRSFYSAGIQRYITCRRRAGPNKIQPGCFSAAEAGSTDQRHRLYNGRTVSALLSAALRRSTRR